MAIISDGNADQVRTFFAEHVQEPVTVELFTQKRSLLTIPGQQECEYCEETESLLNEVVALSPNLSLAVHDLRADPHAGEADGITAEMVPSFVLHGQDRGKIRFLGIPAGYEFSTLIQDIASVSTGTTSLTPATRDALAQLPGDVHIRVFVTPT
ncbi:MAG TPA: hypothetical protein VNL16_00560 [Chloroflexota bacterium]|nr:hypothetical protein [Chloroflexota bacterium]